MSSLTLLGDVSGSIVLDAPPISGSTVITLAAQSGTLNVGGPAFSAYQSTNQSIGSGANTKVTVDTEEFDTNSNFSSSRFTPTVAGYYQINGSVQTAGGVIYISASIFKNGSIYKYGSFGTSMYQSAVSSLVYLNGSTDYVELYVYGNASFSSQNGIQATYFNGCFLRGA